jgi:hypothetical protein
MSRCMIRRLFRRRDWIRASQVSGYVGNAMSGLATSAIGIVANSALILILNGRVNLLEEKIRNCNGTSSKKETRAAEERPCNPVLAGGLT